MAETSGLLAAGSHDCKYNECLECGLGLSMENRQHMETLDKTVHQSLAAAVAHKWKKQSRERYSRVEGKCKCQGHKPMLWRIAS